MDDVKNLHARIIVLEGLVDLLLGKALADSGHTTVALEELEADNAFLDAEYASDPAFVEFHRRICQALADRSREGCRQSLRFPQQWKRRPRRQSKAIKP